MNDLDHSFMAGFDRPDYFGHSLKPFNGIRRYAADCLGLRFFKLHGQAWEDFTQRGAYQGSLDDALMILWLRIVPDSEVMRCRTHPVEQGERMWVWAAEFGIEPGNEKHQRMVELASETINEIMEAVAVPAETGGKPVEADGELPPLPSGPTFAPSPAESPDSDPASSSPAN